MSAGLVIEGITLQHAAELLFDADQTVTQRSSCRNTYLKSLNDVVFALVFSPHVVVTQNLVGLDDDNPGKMLMDKLQPSDLRYLESDSSDSPGRVLEDSEGRGAVIEWLTSLHSIPESQRPYWRDFIVRESAAYLLPHNPNHLALLAQDLEDPSQYIFNKDYWRDGELQGLITGKMVQDLYLRVVDRYQNVSCTAAAEFVQRCVLAHILIFEWYRRVRYDSAQPEERRVHLPHATRATLIPDSDRTRTIGPALEHLQGILMPDILPRLLKNRKRHELVRVIGDEMNDGAYVLVRKRLADAIQLLDSRAIDKIAKDAKNHIRRSNDPPISFRLAVSAKVGPHGPELSFTGEVSGTLRRRRSICSTALARLTRPPDHDPNEWFEYAARVFPELAEGIRQDRR